jgi:predicted phosphoribosyltransferase
MFQNLRVLAHGTCGDSRVFVGDQEAQLSQRVPVRLVFNMQLIVGRSCVMTHLPFEDRCEAGRLLAAELARRDMGQNAIVLALTRGGVPVGFAVADRLHLPLDVIVARKVGVPWQPELAMGAMAGATQILDEDMIRELGISREDVAEIVAREQAEMQRRELLYRGGKPALDLAGRSAIVVDDGLATGSTMVAAVRHARSLHPARVIVAAPVGSRQACAHLRKEADDVVCLAIPERFCAVGEWYRDFRQVDDSEVGNLLAESRRQLNRHAACT